MVTLLMFPGDLPWPAVLHGALHHTTIHLLNQICVASFSTCLYLSLFFPISSFGACSGCCSLFPLLAAALSHCGRKEHTSASLTAGTSKLQDGKPAGTAKLFPSSEKDSSSEKEIKKKSETEVHSISNITLNVTLSYVLKDLVMELPGSLLSLWWFSFMDV